MQVNPDTYQEFVVAEKLLKEAFVEYETTTDSIEKRFKDAARLYHFPIPQEAHGTDSAQ